MKKIVATIAVRDEVDLISHNIDYHLAVGFDGMVIVDIESKDGTKEILNSYSNNPKVHVIHATSQDNLIFNWNHEMLNAAKEIFSADIIAHFDADEFLYSPFYSVNELRELNKSILTVNRYNCISSLSDTFTFPKNNSDCDSLIVANKSLVSEYLQRNDDCILPWLYTNIAPKTIASLDNVSKLNDGGHTIINKQEKIVSGRISKKFIFIHFAITNYARFKKKVLNIDSLADLLNERTSESYAYHWKKWSKIYREKGESGIKQLYDEQVKSASDSNYLKYTSYALTSMDS